MSARHAVAFVLLLAVPGRAWAGGWYLMEPPSKADVDTSCTSDPTVFDRVRALLNSKSSSSVQFDRCLPEAEVIAAEAPLSSWCQAESYQTLKDCKIYLDLQRTADSPPLPCGGAFGDSHPDDSKAYVERMLKNIEKEFKQIWPLREKWYSTLPKETRDREDAYNRGLWRLSPSDVVEAADWHKQFLELEDKFYLSHRSEYPAASLEAASDELNRERGGSSRCIASDDPRLKGK